MANDFVVKGLPALVNGAVYRKAPSSTWDEKSGGTTTLEYTDVNPTNVDGVLPAALIAQAQSLGRGWNTQIAKEHGNGPKWVLTAVYPADLITDPNQTRIPDIQWEIEPNAYEQNILECSDRPFIAALSTQTKAMVENAIKYPAASVPVTNDPTQFDNAWTAYSLKVDGIESRLGFTTTIKRSLIVPTWYNPTWSLTYNRMVLSKSFLVSYYNIPNWVAALMPNSDGGYTTNNSVTTFQGYLEFQPPRKSNGFNRVEISQQWVFNKWSVGPKGLYDTVGV